MHDQNIPAPTTQVKTGVDAKSKLLEGIEVAANVVGCTLGPRGRTVLIRRGDDAPIATKDGVTVSQALRLPDPIMRMGADLVKEAASQTNDVAGDGTTTATILTHALAREGMKLLAAGHSASAICSGFEKARDGVNAGLKKLAKPIATSQEVAHVATVSANGDKRIGKLIAQAMEEVGRDGVITVEDAKGTATSLTVVEGMQFDCGYLSPFFVTNGDKMIAEHVDAKVLITDKKLNDLRDLIPILESSMNARRPLLIIADTVEGDALHGLVLNRSKADLPVVAVKAPGYGENRDAMLGDLCTLTGAKLVSAKTGLAMDKVTLADLGDCKKIIVSAKATTLVATSKTKAEVEARVAELRSQQDDPTLTIDEMTVLQQRIARLAGGVAVIKVGGATEMEMIERKFRIEDALNATRAAAEEGIVPGGGTALIWAYDTCGVHHIEKPDVDTVEAALRLFGAAIEEPLRKIASNAGASPDVIVNSLRQGQFKSDIQYRGYDAATGEEVDMMNSGIIDPVKVTRVALENAVSVAITFLSLDAVVFETEVDP